MYYYHTFDKDMSGVLLDVWAEEHLSGLKECFTHFINIY